MRCGGSLEVLALPLIPPFTFVNSTLTCEEGSVSSFDPCTSAIEREHGSFFAG